jgi:hypothetical protein
VTSSALNLRHPSGQTGANRYRVDRAYTEENFGEIRIRWGQAPQISLSIRDIAGQERLGVTVSLAGLSYPR